MAPPKSSSGWSRVHSDEIRGSAFEVPGFNADQQDELWQQIKTRASTPRRRRVGWRGVVAGVVAVGAVGVAGAAAADVFTAHTGKGPADAEDVELGGPGERLNPSAPDFAAVLSQSTSDIPFPSAQSRNSALSWEVEDLSDEQNTLVSVGALRLWTAGHALCSWSNEWAVALSAADTRAAGRAADVILEARNWPSIKDTDADMADESEAAWVPVLEQAVRSGDPAGAKVALEGQACMPGLAPELGMGKRW